jgi:hypothetical protein
MLLCVRTYVFYYGSRGCSGFLVAQNLDFYFFLSLQDGPDRMAEEAELFKYPFPYLYDEVWPHRALDSEIFQRP